MFEWIPAGRYKEEIGGVVDDGAMPSAEGCLRPEKKSIRPQRHLPLRAALAGSWVRHGREGVRLARD
jgi:hypothetical protein